MTDEVRTLRAEISKRDVDIQVLRDGLMDILDITNRWTGPDLDDSMRLDLIDKFVRDLLGHR